MIIKYPRGLEIELTKEEATEIFYAIKDKIETAIRKHWINYPDSFLSNESTSLGMIRVLCKITNYSYEAEILPAFMDMLKKQMEVK